MTITSKLIDTKEAAKKLGVSPQMVLRYIKQGRLGGARKYGRDYLIFEYFVDTFQKRRVGRPRKIRKD